MIYSGYINDIDIDPISKKYPAMIEPTLVCLLSNNRSAVSESLRLKQNVDEFKNPN